MKFTPRTIALTGLKLVLMGILLALVLRQVHWYDVETVTAMGERRLAPGLASIIQEINSQYYVLAVIGILSSLVACALRWQRVLTLLGLTFRRSEVLKLVFVGDFFNNFLLGSLGGDAVKVFLAVRQRSQKGVILASIFADRLIGLIGLTTHAAIMLIILVVQGSISGRSLWLPVAPIVVVVSGLAGGGILLFSTRLQRLLRIDALASRLPFSDQIRQGGEALRLLFGKPGPLVSVFALTFCCQACSIGAVAFLGLSLNLGVPVSTYLLSAPIVFILSAVPITPGGIGVLEELCQLYFAAAGNPNKVLVLALLIRLTILLCSLPGIVAFWSYGRPEVAEIRSGVER
ncbi:MAG: flippase-like domain-containing protein [Proteobacteria bacterium]|nr:flippase-like domain-containing protein [Desulfobulbaceae bacterium]MBU4152812.1 flippase-like domain-containing protein [Pseudomonadota bacterium]MDP2106973.1 lysylphosphatidylglycerol synthase transmembrane domain-containing protein [Desulfobulbaceae bacterium]